MNFLKSKWRLIVLIVVCLASIGGGAWAYMGGDEITQKLQQIDKLRGDVERLRTSPSNPRTIEEKKKDVELRNARFEESMGLALSTQKFSAFDEKTGSDGKPIPAPRQPLLPNALPQPVSNGVAIDFREAYKAAFAQLKDRLRARDKATPAEIKTEEEIVIRTMTAPKPDDDDAWTARSTGDKPAGAAKDRSLAEILKDYPKSRVAERIARTLYMYSTANALGRHPLADSDDAPKAEAIWQAQMTLWIQQDIVAALARVNEERAAQLNKDGQRDEVWVANMPVKHLLALRISDRLGNGGGSNQRTGADWPPPSFPGLENNDKMFIVPMQLEMIVEEASLNRIIDAICRVGFYTPTSISTYSVDPNPFQDDYIYGDAPLLRVALSFEGYFFRKVFENWIPQTLKETLKKKEAMDSASMARDRGGGG